MNWTRLAAAAIAAWIVSMPLGYVINKILLAGMYAANQNAFRPDTDMMPMLPIGFAATLVGLFVMTYAYAKGYEGGNGTMEGLRFGFIVGLIIVCFAIVWEYVVFPLQPAMNVAMNVDRLFEMTVFGGVIGSIYKPSTAAATV